jgi:hypothetical protein
MKDIEARELASQFGSRMCDENGDTHGEELYCFSLDDIIAIKEALAQPAQEPWRESASDYERGVIDGRQKQAQSSVDKAVNRMAQRPWVDLTDEDWKEIEDMPDTFDQGVAWCLARLKDKNNG